VLSIAKLVARAEEHNLRTVAAGREEYDTGWASRPARRNELADWR
jgi:hypothetical protein